MPTGIYKRTDEYKKKMSEIMKGHFVSANTRRKIGNAHRGKTVSEETRKKLSNSHRGKSYIELFGIVGAIERINKQKQALTNKKKPPRSETHKQNISKATKGKPKPSISKALTGRSYEDLFGIEGAKKKKQKQSESHKKRWQNQEYKEKVLRAIANSSAKLPNKPERQLRNVLNHLFPKEYKYVGDGQVWIGGKNPDFINVNGQKKIIELFGDYWHSDMKTGRAKKEEENQRIDHFAEYGFKTLIIWENELQSKLRLQKTLIEFHNKCKLDILA